MQFILRALLGKILLNPATKAAIMAGLNKRAQSTETLLDDEAVAVFGEVFDVVVPIIVGSV